LAAITAEVIGVFVAAVPKVWLGLFTEDASVLATGIAYLQIVGPSHGAVGFGLLLYFAGQGAGRVLRPVLGGTARLLIAAVFGWAAGSFREMSDLRPQSEPKRTSISSLSPFAIL
jgi:Na+-driven multidrug efflux pump